MAAMEDVPTMPHVLELDSTSDEAALAEAGDVDPVIEPPPPGVGAPAEGRAEASPGAEVAEVADGAELGDSIDPDGEESPELPDPPAVAGAAPRGRKRRRNRR